MSVRSDDFLLIIVWDIRNRERLVEITSWFLESNSVYSMILGQNVPVN